jgi:UDP-N-acetyl-D-glucosamine dehydrogenase
MGLVERLRDKSAVLGVVGLGYVGLPLAVEMGKAGYRVIGLEVNPAKVASINGGESFIPDVPSAEVSELVASGALSATNDFSQAAGCDAVVLCVPTPLTDMKEPDTSFIESAAAAIAPTLHPDMLVTLESTTYPGTTEEVVQPILEKSGLRVGTDFFLAFSPERVDPGNPTFQTRNTPKIVGGVTPECTEAAVALYEGFIDTVVPVSSTRAAEMTKLLENIYRCVNIALVNELMMLSERMDIDIWEVVEAAKTKPFGFQAFYPGPGLGGHCIPIDPFYLSWKARHYDFQAEFIELAGKTNDAMPYYVVNRLMAALNEHRKPLAGSKVLMLGVAYKADIDDLRESPAIKVAKLLLKAGADLSYHDPYVPHFEADGRHLDSVELTPERLAGCEAVVIITNHSSVDYAMVAASAPLVLDTRNALNAFSADTIVRL